MSHMHAGITSRSPPWFLDLTAWTAAFAISGYPIAALISTYMGIADDRTTLPFRVFVVVLALAALWIGARRTSLSAPDRWLIAFWLVYSCRLIWDTYFEYVDGAEHALLAFVVTVLIPAIALALISRTWVERSAALCLMAVGVLVCLIALWLNTRDMVACRRRSARSRARRDTPIRRVSTPARARTGSSSDSPRAPRARHAIARNERSPCLTISDRWRSFSVRGGATRSTGDARNTGFGLAAPNGPRRPSASTTSPEMSPRPSGASMRSRGTRSSGASRSFA